MTFRDRADAGRRLAAELAYLGGRDVVVLGLPRGGVPVAAFIAEGLSAPLDVIVVRKLGVPGQPEVAMGALGEGGIRVVNHGVLAALGVTPTQLAAVERAERDELADRVARLRAGRPGVGLAGRVAIIVDDGIATGATARAACQVARAAGAARIVLAVPVAPPDAITALAVDADEVVCLETPAWFSAVGQFYADFRPVSDEEATAVLRAHAYPRRDEDVLVASYLPGHLTIPPGVRGMVVFAHGSGSGRHSPRGRAVADRLREAGLGTLLFDLHPPGEPDGGFDLPLLAGRLIEATSWLRRAQPVGELPVGYFGASTGAAVALAAASALGDEVAAVVARGGRPDLVGPRLSWVRAPTLLIVGGADSQVLRLNQEAATSLRAPHRVDVVPGASHLFTEAGALETVGALAADWFTEHLAAHPVPVAV